MWFELNKAQTYQHVPMFDAPPGHSEDVSFYNALLERRLVIL